jgi:hippurate hydrolase
MIRAGALTDRIGGFAAEAIVGFHNWPGLPMGSVAVGDGPVMAGADRLRITVEGRGGHAAMPHLTDDVNVAASALVQALQTIISRRRRFTDAALLSICQLQAGHSNNVLPGHAALDGTLRYLDPDLRGLMHDEVHRICKGIGIAFGCRISAEFDNGYPPTINDAALAEAAERIATENGLDVVIDQLPTGAAEDFAFYGRHVPSVYLKLGADDRSGPRPGLHTDQFDFNDALITPAVELLSSLAVALP